MTTTNREQGLAGAVVTAECGKCRWHKNALGPSGARLALKLGPSHHVGDGNWIENMGMYMCEHADRPRGMVPASYGCRDFEHPPEIDDQVLIESGRAALRTDKQP